MIFLIDDQLSLERGVARAQAMCGAICRLLVALGFTLSIQKCQLEPAQLLKFLGLLVDLLNRAFRVPEGKLEQLVEMARQCQTTSLTDRLVARVAGKVMALAPAVHLAPLVARDMWKASQGTSWDSLYPTPRAFHAAVELLVELLARSNGKKWERRTQLIKVVGDASESALAALSPDLPGPVVIPFSLEEMEAVRLNKWSSTAREMAVVSKVVDAFEGLHPGFLSGKRLVYFTDNQPAMYDFMGMKGAENTFPVVRETLLHCQAVNVELEVRWRPRSHPEQQVSGSRREEKDKGLNLVIVPLRKPTTSLKSKILVIGAFTRSYTRAS